MNRTVIVVLALLFVCLTAYSVYSVLTWRSLDTERQVWQAGMVDRIKKALDGSMSAEARLTILETISKDIDTGARDVCAVASPIDWQMRVLPSLRSAQEQCQQELTRLTDATRPLRDIVQFAHNERQLADVLAPTAKLPQRPTEKDWQTILTSWQQTSTAINELEKGEDFQPVQRITKEKVDAIVSAWQRIIAADKAENRSAFTSARQILDTRYDELGDITTVLHEQRQKLLAAFEKDYNTLH